MKDSTVTRLALVVSILSGLDAIQRNINNVLVGVTSWFNTLAPIVQLGLVFLTLYLANKKK